MFKSLLLFLTLITCTLSINAQVSVKGKVAEADGAIPYVNVSLYKTGDTIPIKRTQTDSAGLFLLKDVPAAEYILRVSFLGYHTYQRQIVIPAGQQQMLLEDIILIHDARQLKELVIEGEKKAIRYEASKMVLQVAGNSTFRSSANVLDVLRKAPGLTVNSDGSLLVSGRNAPVIFINGKPIPMSPEETLAYLNGMSPDMISSIEVVSNPSSKYDGQYKAIIDIKLKSDPSLGWKGSINSSLRQNKYTSADNNLNLSYKSEKAAYTLRGGYIIGDDFYQYTALQRLASNNVMETYTRTRTANNNLALQFGADYELTKHQTLEVSVKTYQANRNLDAFNTLTFREPSGRGILDIDRTLNQSDPVQRNYAFNAAYNIRLSQDANLNVFGSLTTIRNEQQEDIQISDQLAGTLSNYWKTGLKNDIFIRSIQADYSQNIKKGVLETGGKFSYITTDNDLKYDTLANTIFVPDAGRTNRFKYNEYVSAAYASYGYKSGKFDFKLSIRAEHTHTTANSVTDHTVRSRDYLTWLPAASATYAINGAQRLSLNFNRRMTRPDFDQLNPFRFYLSPLNYRVGNPYLRPSIPSTVNVAYSYNNFNIVVTAGREKDLMTRYPEYNRVTNELLYLCTNLPYSDFGSIETGYTFPLTRWWKTTHNAGVYYNRQRMPYLGTTYAIGVTDYAVNGSQVFTLPGDIIADLTYRYQSKSGNSLYIRKPMGSVDLGIQKKWSQGRLNTKLNVYDIFYTHVFSLIFREKAIIDNRFTHRFATRRVVLALAYSIGKANYKTKQNRSGEEENRAGH
jgi:hypothetical protein